MVQRVSGTLKDRHPSSDRRDHQHLPRESSMAVRDDEVDLLELLRGLWHERKWVSAVALAVTACAVLYALISPAIYETKISLFAPVSSQFADLNEQRAQVAELAPLQAQDLYKVFTRSLESDELKQRFFNEVYLSASAGEGLSRVEKQGLYRQMIGKLVILADKQNSARYTVSFQDHDPEQASHYLERYIDLANELARREVVNGSQLEAQAKAEDIQRSMQASKQTASASRQDRIAQLKEALKVAEAVGVVNPAPVTSQTFASDSASGTLMYLRGVKALKAEIEALQGRVSDEPFIQDYRAMEEQYERIRQIHWDNDQVATFRFDGQIEPPVSPVKPRRLLILALGAALGLMLGALTGIVVSRLRQVKQFAGEADDSTGRERRVA